MADNKVKITIETDAGRSEQVLNGVKNSLQGVEKQYKSTAKESQSFSVSNGKSLASVAASLKSLGIAFTAAKAAKEAFFLSKDASRYNEMALYAKNAADSMGINFDRMVEASKRGANGMTSNINIMQANLRALKLGLNASADEIGRLWEIANATGDELGQSIEQTFDQITNAIVTGNSRSLISLGVLSDNFKKAGNSAEMLEKRGDLLKTVLEELGKKADTLNKYGDTGYDKYQKLDTAFQNLKTTVGQQLTPAFETCVEWLTKIIEAGDKAIQVLGKVLLLNNEGNKNPYLAYSKEELEKIQEQKRGEIFKYKSYADIVSGKNNIPPQSLTDAQKAEIFGPNKYNWANEAKAEEERLKLVEDALEKINALEKKRVEIKNKQIQQAQQQSREQQAEEDTEAWIREIEKRAEKARQEQEKVAEAAKRAAEKAREEYQKFTNEINNGFNRALGISNKSLSEFIELSYNAGMATLGFGGQVDKAAAELYELEKPFNDMLKEEEKLRDVQIALENIDKIDFNNLYKAAGNMDSMVKAANELWIGQAMGMASTAIGVKDITKSKTPKETAREGWGAIKEQVVSGLSEAVTSGIINSNLGDVLRSLVSSIAASKATSYGSNILGSLFSGGKIATGALSGFVGSIAIGAIANNWKKWFGDKNKSETMASNASTKERGSKAYLQTYAAMLNPYMTDEMLDDLYSTRWASSGMYVSWKSSRRGGLAGLAGGKNYTDTTPQYTYDLISAMENAVKAVEKYNDKKEKELDLLNSQGYSYQVLTEQVNALSNTMDRIKYMGDEYTHSWTSGEKFSIDLSDNIQDLKKAYYEALREYGEETGARNQQKANAFMNLYPYLDDYNIGQYVQYSWFGGKRKKGDINDNASLMYSRIGDVQENLLNRYADPRMLQMVKQAGFEQFNLASMQYTTEDTSKYTEAYLKVLERQKEAAELVMQQQEQIYLDMTKTFEEQSAALETYQQAQEQYYNTKLEILAQERAKEEQLKKEEQQAKLRTADRMEALLGFTGEMAKRGDNNIYILEGADQIGALREMEKYIDDPEALAFVQRLITAALNKNKYGKIG